MMLLPFKIEDRVHQVFEDTRPCQRALLGDVANEKRGDSPPLRQEHQATAALSHLAHAPRRGFEVGEIDGLD